MFGYFFLRIRKLGMTLKIFPHGQFKMLMNDNLLEILTTSSVWLMQNGHSSRRVVSREDK